MRRTFLCVTADVLAGLGALVLFVVCDSFLHIAADLRSAVIVLALFCLAAGFVRGAGRPENTWLKGLLVAAGAMLAFILLGWNSIIHAVVAILLLITSLFAVCGAGARKLWSRQSSTKGALMMLLIPVAAVVIVSVTIIPSIAATIATRHMAVAAPIPVFTVVSDDARIDSSALRGRVVVLSFWATWCPACRREIPELDQLYRRYRNNPSVEFFAVDVGGGGETAETAKAYMRKGGYALPVAFTDERMSEDLGDGLPSLVILDKLGRRRLLHTGYDQSEQFQSHLSEEIDALLHEHGSIRE